MSSIIAPQPSSVRPETGRPVATTSVSSTDGVTLALHDLGGSGTDVLVCHATGFHGPAYLPFARELAAHHHVWALDFRAHGDSTMPDGDLSWDGMADDVVAVLEHLGLTDALVVGHSLGGAAVLLAARARPELIGRAWLFEPIVFPTGFRQIGGAHPMAVGASNRMAEFATRSHALARYAGSRTLGRLRADALWAYVEYGFELVDSSSGEQPDPADPRAMAMTEGPVRLKCAPADEAAVFKADVKVTVDRIAGLELTADIVTGGRVPVAFGPHALAAGIVEQMPNATLREMEHVAHLGPLEDPDSAASAAHEFLARSDDPGSDTADRPDIDLEV